MTTSETTTAASLPRWDMTPVYPGLASVEFREGFAKHSELCVTAGRLDTPFKIHELLLSMSLAKRPPVIPSEVEESRGDTWN